VRVEAVAEPATRAGLREGDIVMAVANTEIKNVKEFEAVLARLDKTKPVAILLRRGEWAQYTLIRPLK
jgi:serine protease Do